MAKKNQSTDEFASSCEWIPEINAYGVSVDRKKDCGKKKCPLCADLINLYKTFYICNITAQIISLFS
ncbi:hypothetical protein AYI69_g2023 [Smittium culicis]|uniref:Uncharacterized protein n=1 Tax=Smittium culicis TaxID=133412 RepID=A0A1R1YNL1_9FUNG|nr:hypothetical protein AYI69_g2023 [Smittium culicis]